MRILKPWLPAIVWAGLILFASGDHFSSASSGGLFQAVFGAPPPAWLHFMLRKLAHLVSYAVLASLTWRADKRWMVVMAIVLAVASADELLQSRSVARTGSPWDVALDLVGGGLALQVLKAQRLKGSEAQRKAKNL